MISLPKLIFQKQTYKLRYAHTSNSNAQVGKDAAVYEGVLQEKRI